MKRLYLLFLLSVLGGIFFLSASCAWLPGPPDPTPTPTPPPWECELDMPYCHETDPPQQCSSEESPCAHNPSTTPEHCEEAPRCATPPPPELPQPQCMTFTDRGGTFRTRSGQCDCYFGQAWSPCEPEPPPTGCVSEPNLVAITCFAEEFRNEVKKATDTLGDLTGGDPQENLRKVAEQLRIQMPGRCVIAGIEAVFIVRDDGKYEENHTVFFGNGGWTGSGYGKYIGCHYDVTGGGTPPPTEPPTGACPAPHPNLTGMKFKQEEKGNHLDTTWVTVNQEPFCAEIGMSPMDNGTLRAGCPVRPEGNDERGPCEAELCDQKWE